MEPAGQDSEMPIAARNVHSTAPFAPECQSFLDNLPAGLGQKDQQMIPPSAISPGAANLPTGQELGSRGRSILGGGPPRLRFTE
jgi:hypothetical protein